MISYETYSRYLANMERRLSTFIGQSSFRAIAALESQGFRIVFAASRGTCWTFSRKGDENHIGAEVEVSWGDDGLVRKIWVRERY